MPVGSIARLFKRYNGTHGVAVKSAPSGLDIAASRAGNKVFLHVANLEYRKTIEASFAVEGLAVARRARLPDRPRQSAGGRKSGPAQRVRAQGIAAHRNVALPGRRGGGRRVGGVLNKPSRLYSLDALRGLVMIIMALDHVRDFVQLGRHDAFRRKTWRAPPRFSSSPAGSPISARPSSCSPAAWAPSSMAQRNPGLSRFLWTRGLWLIVLELTVMRVSFYFSFRSAVPHAAGRPLGAGRFHDRARRS